MPDLERTLREVGNTLAYPELQSQASAALSRLERERRPGPRRRTVIVAVGAAVIALAAASLAVSAVRTAIFDWFGFAGEGIVVVDKLPTLDRLVDLRAGAGERMLLPVAQHRLPYAAPVPRLEDLGPPNAVYLREIETTAGPVFRVSLLWGKPGAYRLLFSATARTPALARQQSHIVRKKLGADFRIKPYTWTSVNGQRALWISVRHQYLYTAPSRGFAFRARPAARVLLWQTPRFAFRLEGSFELEEALRIGRSVG